MASSNFSGEWGNQPGEETRLTRWSEWQQLFQITWLFGIRYLCSTASQVRNSYSEYVSPLSIKIKLIFKDIEGSAAYNGFEFPEALHVESPAGSRPSSRQAGSTPSPVRLFRDFIFFSGIFSPCLTTPGEIGISKVGQNLSKTGFLISEKWKVLGCRSRHADHFRYRV